MEHIHQYTYNYLQNNSTQIQQQQQPQQQHQQDLGCDLIGLSGIIVQLMLAVVAFCILIVKRALEHPPRHPKVWFFDTFKQIISQLTTHSLNVIFSMIMSQKQQEIMAKKKNPTEGPDQCNFYLVTILIDTSVCVFIACYTLQYIENKFLQKKYNLRQGNFYSETQVKNTNTVIIEILIKNWFKQLGIWLSIVFTVKLSMFAIQYIFEYQLGQLSFFVLYYLNPYPLYKLILVMMIVPTFMNMLLFWVQDNFLQQKKTIENQLQISQELHKQIKKEYTPEDNNNDNNDIIQKQKVFEKVTQDINNNNIKLSINSMEQSNNNNKNKNDNQQQNNLQEQSINQSQGQITEMDGKSQKESFLNQSNNNNSINKV